MIRPSETRGLWLRTRYRDSQYDGEACLLVYDVEAFSDLLVSGDIKQVFEKRAGTANIFIAAPFLTNEECREALRPGTAAQRAAPYMSAKSGNVYLLETQPGAGQSQIAITATRFTWEPDTQEATFGKPEPLNASLREGWLFDLFDSHEGLVVAPPGIHFRKSSSKHSDKFLRAANTLTTSNACGLLALFALELLGKLQPKRILVDTAPLLSLSYALMRVARVHRAWTSDAPAKSFSSYGGSKQLGRLSSHDVILISATTSGSLAASLVDIGADPASMVTLYYLRSISGGRLTNVLCDLTVTGDRAFGYQALENFPSDACRLCKSQYMLAELEGDQFLLQQRQHRLLHFVKATQSSEARSTLTELHQGKALLVVMRPDTTRPMSIKIDEHGLWSCPEIRKDFIRLLRRYCPQPLGLIVLVGITEGSVNDLFAESGMKELAVGVPMIDWSHVATQPKLAEGRGVVVLFGFLASHSEARQVNTLLRSIVNEGNVAYLSALTPAATPEQYQDLETFLSYGARGRDAFTYRDARRLALPGTAATTNPWEDELALLERLAVGIQDAELDARRTLLSSQETTRDKAFLRGRNGDLAIQRDFVFLNTEVAPQEISQADVFAVVSNLFASARAMGRTLTKKAAGNEVLTLAQSVYGHVLLSPESFSTFSDAILRASMLRAARPGELMYEVEPRYSEQMREIILGELAAWPAATGDALPEILLALATSRLRLCDIDRIHIRRACLSADLNPFLTALANAIPA